MFIRLLERRRRSQALATVLVSFLAMVVVAVLAIDSGDTVVAGADRGVGLGGNALTAADTTTPVTDDAISRFAAFATERRADREASPNHAYTARGLRQLAAALEAVADRSTAKTVALREQSEMLRAMADSLQRDSGSTRHADLVRAAFLGTAGSLRDLQRQRYPHLERASADLRDAARGLASDRPLLKQSAAVERFFTRASDLIRAMAGA